MNAIKLFVVGVLAAGAIGGISAMAGAVAQADSVEPPLSEATPPIEATPVLGPVPVASAPDADIEPDASKRTTIMRLGFYAHARYRWVQNDPDSVSDENGFALSRVRPNWQAEREISPGVIARARLEGELMPQFGLVDAFMGVVIDGRYSLDVGQQRAPVSRRGLTSESSLAFPEQAALAQLAPGRQIGALLRARDPFTDWVTLSLGVFNGEGRNQTQNIDEKYLFAGRLAITPLGTDRYAESAFGGDFVTLAVSAATNSLEVSANREEVVTLGVDLAGSYGGFSGAIEYLQAEHSFEDSVAIPNYRANGFSAQVNYLLPPIGGVPGRLEIGARVDEIDENDTIGIDQPGDENQSLRAYSGVVSHYFAKHDLKVSMSYAHIVEVEDVDRNGNDATFGNDQFLLQMTYRGEQ
ncbi:MAG: hypothetical protein IPL79_03015 [Myxococcales bacterium]|nr:hypothetical protein [Myxococcales bacterium]